MQTGFIYATNFTFYSNYCTDFILLDSWAKTEQLQALIFQSTMASWETWKNKSFLDIPQAFLNAFRFKIGANVEVLPLPRLWPFFKTKFEACLDLC